jgi:O-antigen ligase
MNREKLDDWCEKGILLLVLALLVVGPLATGAVHTFDFLAVQALAIAGFLLWVIRLWIVEKPKLLWPPVTWAVVAFGLLAIARYATCDIEYVGRHEMLRVLTYAFIFLLIINNLHRQEHVQAIALTLVFLAMGIAFYALYQYFTGSNQVWTFTSPYKHRASGTYISPNHLGGFLEMVLPLGLALCITGRVSAPIRILVGYASLVVLAGIVVTLSRGAMVATFAALVVFFVSLLLYRKYRFSALITLAVFAAGAVYLLPKAISLRLRFDRILTSNEINENMRYSLWDPALRMWRDNPVWGVGPGHFDSLFRSYRPPGVQLQPDWVHNDYLNTLADWGIVGTLIVIAAWVLLGIGVVQTWRAVRPQYSDFSPLQGSNKFAITLGATLGLFAILAHSWVDFNMHIPANAILCVSLMAVLASHIRFATNRYWYSANLPVKLILSVAILSASGYMAVQGWKRGSESIYVSRANAESKFSPEQIAWLKKAHEVEPNNPAVTYRIGESYRIQSFEGGSDYQELATDAMRWFEKTTQLNPWDGYGYLRYGMCLDWLDRSEESGKWFETANRLDPNGYFSVAHMGLHYVHRGNYAAAIPWFERSLRLQSEANTIARSYLEISTVRLLEGATNENIILRLAKPSEGN